MTTRSALSCEAIAHAARCPLRHVEEAWPLVVSALEELGIHSAMVEIAAAATIAVETGSFLPLRERRASRERQPELWAAQNRYWESGFYGRGFIQLTWDRNYREYSKALGRDLVMYPDLMLEPVHAAKALAHFFKRTRIDEAANAQDWRSVRRLVNGGFNGWDAFNTVVCELLEALNA